MSARRLVGMLGCGLLWFGTWELAARIEDWLTSGASPWRPYGISTLFRESAVGREGVPNARFGKWRMNRLGFRGEDPRPDRPTVLAIGASETFGQSESPGHEYPRVLEDELGSVVPGGYNVSNAALPGMRLGRIEYLERALRMTRPRYVVVYPSPAHYVGVENPFCGQSTLPMPVAPLLAERVRIVGRLQLLAKRVAPAALMDLLRELDLWRISRGIDVVARAPEASVAAFGTDLDCAIDAIVAHGAVPVLLTHASYFGALPEPSDGARAMLVAWRRSYPDISEGGLLDLEHRANGVVREVAARRGALLFDAARTIPPGPEHFSDFVHFTDLGARRMAREIAAIIARRDAISRSPRRTGGTRRRGVSSARRAGVRRASHGAARRVSRTGREARCS